MPKTPVQSGPPHIPGLRGTLARNLSALLEKRFGEDLNKAGKLARLKPTNGLFTCQRVLAGTSNVGIDMIEVFAKKFGLEPWQLLLPGLKVDEPQIAIHKRYFAMAEQMAREIVGSNNK